MSSQPPCSWEDRLQILLLDYNMARSDERQTVATQATIFGVAVALIAAVTALTTQTCQLQNGKKGCAKIPDAVLAGVPLGPLALISFLMLIGTVATIRSYYLRALEVELREYVNRPFKSFRGIPLASYVDLTLEIASLRRGHVGYRIVTFIILIALVVGFGGLTVYIALHVNTTATIAMAIVYGSATLVLLGEATRATIGGRGTFVRLAQSYAHRAPSSGLPDLTERNADERSLLSYLVLPRPEDLVKIVFLPASFGLAAWSLGGVSGHDVARAALVWLALEYFIYEARYQWNDTRGIETDSRHGDRRSRGRLPVGRTARDVKRNIATSLVVAALRVGIALVGAWLLGFDTFEPVLLLTILVFGTALVYESLKRAAVAVPPTHGGAIAARAVWLLVGLGYAYRGIAGLLLAGVTIESTIALLAVPVFVGFGTAFVTLTWVLDAVSQCRAEMRSEDEPMPVSPLLYDADLNHQRHLSLLLKYIDADTAHSDAPIGLSCRTVRAVASRGKTRAPWNIALVASALAAGPLGMKLAGEDDLLRLLLSGAICAVAVGVFVTASRSSYRWAAVVLGALVLLVHASVSDAAPALAAPIPWLLVSAVVAAFRDMSYASLKLDPDALASSMRRMGECLGAVIVGKATRDFIGIREGQETGLEDVLTLVSANPGITTAQIAEKLCINRSGVYRLLEALRHSKLVTTDGGGWASRETD
jgi:hypothetical protein